MAATCNASAPAPYRAIACNRDPDHDGPHRGDVADNEVIFWSWGRPRRILCRLQHDAGNDRWVMVEANGIKYRPLLTTEADGPTIKTGATLRVEGGKVSEAAPGKTICPECNGRGEVLDAPDRVLEGRPYYVPCDQCGGTGHVKP